MKNLLSGYRSAQARRVISRVDRRCEIKSISNTRIEYRLLTKLTMSQVEHALGSVESGARPFRIRIAPGTNLAIDHSKVERIKCTVVCYDGDFKSDGSRGFTIKAFDGRTFTGLFYKTQCTGAFGTLSLV